MQRTVKDDYNAMIKRTKKCKRPSAKRRRALRRFQLQQNKLPHDFTPQLQAHAKANNATFLIAHLNSTTNQYYLVAPTIIDVEDAKVGPVIIVTADLVPRLLMIVFYNPAVDKLPGTKSLKQLQLFNKNQARSDHRGTSGWYSGIGKHATYLDTKITQKSYAHYAQKKKIMTPTLIQLKKNTIADIAIVAASFENCLVSHYT